MHPDNPYREALDFAELGEAYAPLKPYLTKVADGRYSINFHDEAAQKRLTEAILKRDFGLTLSLPDDRLCPPVPNRLNYVLWIRDIMRACDVDVPLGLDIGTGASAIYPLLACSLNPTWSFIATDVDEASFDCAVHNVQQNGLVSRIALVKASQDGPIFPDDLTVDRKVSNLDHHPKKLVSFTMCNPPFYNSREEVLHSAAAKELGPNAVCTGAEVEMITAGGEVGFVTRMIQESLLRRNMCLWFTSMLGKLSSLAPLVKLLRTNNVDNYGITEFVQGHTRRWALAWSFNSFRLPDTIARISNPSVQSLMPARVTLYQPLSGYASMARLAAQVELAIATLEGVTMQSIVDTNLVHVPNTTMPCNLAWFVTAIRNTWSRSARRAKKANITTAYPPEPTAASLDASDGGPCMKARLRADSSSLEIQWVYGLDRALFESFASHLGRKMLRL